MAEQRVQRRLAAILASDIVGYSRLMEADEAGTLDRLKALRTDLLWPKVAEYNGRIVKTTGDGTLIEFPSAVDAVSHAVEVQRELARHAAAEAGGGRIELRIGINVGDIMIDDDDIYGDGVNVAARLEGLAAPGGICVSANVYEQVQNKLDLAFDDLGEQTVKNIARPVRAYSIALGGLEARPPDTDAAPPLPDKPSIAVLPFQNISGDPEQEYFADGMTEDIITDLSQIPALFVIARNSSFVFKGQPVDVKDVGTRLGVRYVLEGSVRKAGNKVRINAQLIDATTGGHLWAKRYDGDFDDIFALQDAITEQIVAGLEVNLTGREKAPTARATARNPEAYDLLLRARGADQPATRDGIAFATELLERAVALDPNFADAYAMLGRTYVLCAVVGWGEGITISRAVEAARHAVALDDGSALAHAYLGWSVLFERNYDTCVAEMERAIALDPNGVDAYFYLAESWNYMGEPKRSMEISQAAMRRNPLFPHGIHFAHSYYLLEDYDHAISIATEAAQRAPGHPICQALLTAICVELGRADEAKLALERLMRAAPRLTLSFIERTMPYRVPAMRDRFLEDLRKAGLPE